MQAPTPRWLRSLEPRTTVLRGAQWLERAPGSGKRCLRRCRLSSWAWMLRCRRPLMNAGMPWAPLTTWPLNSCWVRCCLSTCARHALRSEHSGCCQICGAMYTGLGALSTDRHGAWERGRLVEPWRGPVRVCYWHAAVQCRLARGALKDLLSTCQAILHCGRAFLVALCPEYAITWWPSHHGKSAGGDWLLCVCPGNL